MKKLIVILILALTIGCASHSDFNKAKKQLESQGYTDVKYTGHKSFCCGEDDSFSTGFECKDRSGNKVEGCICSAALKGITIRFE